MSEKPYSAYAERNAKPILEVLQHEFRDCSNVLEIGARTGQHAIRFAAALDYLQWQPSDVAENCEGINAWIEDSGLSNVGAPLSLDVLTADVPQAKYDAVYSSNTAHIMTFEAVIAMFALVGKALRTAGVFCLYGPFRRAGAFNTESNAAFDADLRSRDPVMGIRDLESLDTLGAGQGLRRISLYAVPSNNLVAVWQKTGGVQ